MNKKLIWTQLVENQYPVVSKYASKEYLQGLDLLDIKPGNDIAIESINQKLKSLVDWQVVLVDGLLSEVDFFKILKNKKFPISRKLRSESEIDYSPEPDYFHDLFGHVPLLTNKWFSGFLFELSSIAYDNNYNKNVIDCLSRIFWYTYEVGLMMENDQIKAYGGAILSSNKEYLNVYGENSQILPFNFEVILEKDYNYNIQEQYYFINDVKELYDCIPLISKSLNSVCK